MVYGKKEIYGLLEDKGIECEIYEHEAVYTMEELEAQELPELGNIAKNLFVRDEKKKNWALFVVRGEQRVNLKELGAKVGLKGLSFASEKYLDEKMKLYAGAVSPFGVLNDEACCVKVYMDECFRGGIIAVHPNDNTASVYLKTDDLVGLLREHGSEVEYISY